MNLKAINRYIEHRYFAVIYAIIKFETTAIAVKTARCRWKLRYVGYQNLQSHHAVLPAIARHLVAYDLILELPTQLQFNFNLHHYMTQEEVGMDSGVYDRFIVALHYSPCALLHSTK